MNTDTIPPFSIPSPLPGSMRKRPGVGLFIGLSAVVTLVLFGSILGAYFLLYPSVPPPLPPFAGQAFFMSSAQWNDSSIQGDNDELQIKLQNMPAPDPGKIYYAWLLSDNDQSPMVALPLGVLPDHGNVQFLYKDAQHSNLLATTSRLLITEENRGSAPTHPSSDHRMWRYHAELPQKASASGASQPNALSAIRALLYQEPHLSQVGIHDDLNIQFLRNMGKIQEWIFSAKDVTESWGNHDAGFIHRQIVNVLEYLDGTNAVQADVPPGTPLRADSPIPLIDVAPNQGSSSYIGLIHEQLTNLMAAPGVTPRMHKLALESDQALTAHVQLELIQVRMLAKTLVFMPEAQLLSPPAQALLSSMMVLANVAFIGQLDQTTNEPQPGVVQIFYEIQSLAAYDIKPY
ncbi:MAG: anti-sigma factor [Ktedonobacteraceae bacterium]